MRISNDLKIYVSYTRVAEAHLALAKEINSKDKNYYTLIKDKMQKWIYNILNIFETQMLRKGKFYYVNLINILRKDIAEGFKGINNLEERL